MTLGEGSPRFGNRWSFSTNALLATVLISAVLALVKSLRNVDPIILVGASLAATLAGWGLAVVIPIRAPKTKQSWDQLSLEAMIWIGSILGGCGVSFIFAGRLGLVTIKAMLAWLHLLTNLWPVGWDSQPALVAQMADLGVLRAGLDVLAARLWAWFAGSVSGSGRFDPVAVSLAVCGVIWLTAFWASWSINRRRQVLQGIAPAGIIAVAALNYTGTDPSALLVMLGATLLLLTLVHYDDHERRWRTQGIDYAETIRMDIVWVSLLITTGLVTLAILARPVSLPTMIDFFDRLTHRLTTASGRGEQDSAAQSLGLAQSNAQGLKSGFIASTGLPRQHLLGSGAQLSTQVVMLISTGELPPGFPSAGLVPESYYWRAFSYDQYIGIGWNSSSSEVVSYSAETTLFPKLPSGYRLVRQKVQARQEFGGVLYAAGAVISVDQAYQVAWRGGRMPGGASEISLEAADAFGIWVTGQSYQVISAVPQFTVEQLRAATGDYPTWIKDRYLDLPEDIPLRVLILAQTLTATGQTPYDRAAAIESDLRAISYTLDLPTPPPGRDVVDYFLFDLKKGYCDYYASAMVVLARAAGLPARLVVGYSSGQYDPAQARYVVTEANAHSWVEVYFTGIGWIPFEPTAGRPAIERDEMMAGVNPDIAQLTSPEAASKDWSVRWTALVRLALGWAGAAALLIGLALAGYQAVERWLLGRMPPGQAIQFIYRRLYRLGRRLAVCAQIGDTPEEFAAALNFRLESLGWRGRLASVIRPALAEISFLTALYNQTLFSQHLPGVTGRLRAVHAWQKLCWRLWAVKIIGPSHG